MEGLELADLLNLSPQLWNGHNITCLISCLIITSQKFIWGLNAFKVSWILDSKLSSHYFVHSHQFSSVAQSCPTLQSHRLQHTRPPCPCPPITNIRSLLKLTSITSVMPSNHLILCHLLFLPPSIFPSIRVFSNGSAICIRWPKYWCFSFSISPSSE